MRGRSYSYSPSPPRRYSHRRRSPSPRGHYRGRGRDLPTSLLVRNLHKDCREPRGFGFVQYVDPADAADAKYHMDGQILLGRELTVVFAEENRKKPQEMRARERRRSYDYRSPRRYSRSPRYARTYSRSPGYSPSPVQRRNSRFDIECQSHQDTKGIGTDLTPGHLMDREAAVEAGATVGVTAGATVEALATPGEVKYASSMNTTEDVVVF
ncbi:hypothetical protein Ahy_A02g004988 isoform B [Arachis hypogaea]|uniref:RRM domain-containing protein n=1 Tax=Arachis hypogaea TaxID=3818 RepID=A0A445E5E0_ARAHY|nr:hypothetical protein Ahy_A02g004988 isoform A [Arachis hypogaea]RYR70661.1 hypothetical protein Ahy_A02g004988 isoform B [Arachis hypogaea]